MANKPLSQTNPYLRDHKHRAEMVRANVLSSTAIEGVHLKSLDKVPTAKKISFRKA